MRLLSRFKSGLKKSTSTSALTKTVLTGTTLTKTVLTGTTSVLTEGLRTILMDTILMDTIFQSKKLDTATLSKLEDLLIMSDLGLSTSGEIIAELKQQKITSKIDDKMIKTLLADIIEKRLTPYAQQLNLTSHHPFVILMTGMNGSGKTTTIGKLAHQFLEDGKSVMLAAGDTFRAAAIEQLTQWGEKINVPVIKTKKGADPSGLAFEALTKARETKTDILIIDTAGRLHSNKNLMAELEKMIRVLRKIDETAPHASLLVLDATIGQNAITQAQTFRDMTDTTGIIMTKLDGTARGGILLPIATTLDLPIYFIGLGEKIDDLQVFNAENYAKALVGLS